MYRNSFQTNGDASLRNRYRIVLILCILFFISTVVLAFSVGGNGTFRTQTNAKLQQMTRTAVSNALSTAEMIDGSVSSITSGQLAEVRQYVYLAQQLSELSVSLSGEGARLIPYNFFDNADKDVYDVLDAFDEKVKGATSSTIDNKTQLITQLQNLQNYLSNN